MDWYYATDGNQTGPVSESEIAGLIRSGVVRGDTFVWHNGMTDWAQLQSTELAAHFRQKPPASPLPTPAVESGQPEENPYEPVTISQSACFDYRSPKGLSVALVISFTALILTHLVLSTVVYFNPELLSDTAEEFPEGDANVSRLILAGVGYFATFVVCVVLWCIWTNRCAKNVRALGAKPESLQYTPGWAVGWYFIPIAFWWKPYQAHKEIWMATESPTRPDYGSAPGIVGIWWAFWVVMNLFSNFSSRINAADLQAPLAVIEFVLTSAAAICAIAVCVKLSALQDERAKEAGLART